MLKKPEIVIDKWKECIKQWNLYTCCKTHKGESHLDRTAKVNAFETFLEDLFSKEEKKDLERLHILVGELRARQMSSGIVVIPKPDQGGLQFKFDVVGDEADACRALAREMDMVEVKS